MLVTNLSTATYRLNAKLRGSCVGPELSIVNNPRLAFILFHNETVVDLHETNALVMSPEWDIQELGECHVPTPFSSLHDLLNCSLVYGPLEVNEATKPIKYSPNMNLSFTFNGCIHVRNSSLKDFSFLTVFARYRPTPDCSAYITGNKMLCPEWVDFANKNFPSITIENNGEKCDKCRGGVISKDLLTRIKECEVIDGDVIIMDIKELPKNIGNLRVVKTITGSVYILNNPGLKNFDYFKSLQSIGESEDPDNESVVLTVENNPNLRSLSMPGLLNFAVVPDSPKVRLRNNPKLVLVKTTVTTTELSALVFSTSVGMPDRVAVVAPNLVESPHSSSYTLSVVLILTGVAILIVVCIALAFVARYIIIRRRNPKFRLPQPPYDLPKKSKDILASLSKEITGQNPFVWCAKDFDLTWNKKKENRSGAGKDTTVILNPPHFVKKNLIPLSVNARLSMDKIVQKDKYLQHRVREFPNYDCVIAIGSGNDVQSVIPYMPKNINESFIYVDLTAGNSNPNIFFMGRPYSYQYKDDSKQKVIDMLYYQWKDERFPKEFAELLRILMRCDGSKVICTSTRRKEAFSLLRLLFMMIFHAKQSMSIVETVSLHTEFCNGAPLDQHEVIYILRIVMEWANRAGCFESDTEKESYQKWCHEYELLSNFSRSHHSIMSIHPRHLEEDDSTEETLKTLTHLRSRFVTFSERPYIPIIDPYRPLTKEEKRWRQTHVEEQNSAVPMSKRLEGSVWKKIAKQ
ncbi:hypothetical protein Q1695_012585 [Nippostrongylus brasiliensis]|nr:hypothetical protein Q1695_012585 [Nippostrongylus brasiliensis]